MEGVLPHVAPPRAQCARGSEAEYLQAAMKHTPELLRSILDALPCPLFWKGRDFRYLGCNTAFARLAGKEHPDQVVGLDDYQLPWSKEDSDLYRACDEKVLSTGLPLPDTEERVWDGDGERHWTQTSKVPLFDARGHVFGVLGVLLDITAWRDTQTQLRRALATGETTNRMLQEQAAAHEAMQRALALSELRLRTVVREAQMVIWSLDAQGLFTFSDGGGLRDLGLTPGQNLGRSVFDVYKDMPRVLEQTRRALAGEAFSTHVLVKGMHYETRFTPIHDESGTVQGTIGVALDVSERVRAQEQLEAELDRTRGQLLQVERLASLGTLAAGVGHELRNISTVLDSLRGAFVECAERGVPPAREELEELERVCAHVATHGRHLMDLGRPGNAAVERVDLRELVSGTLAMLRTAGVTRYVRVSAAEPGEPLWVRASRTRVEQVLLNLVRNAADAVESVKDRPAEVRVRLFEECQEGWACCRVEDTGVGIPAENLGSIFEPWFTTKPPGRGTGLGLPVVRNLLREAGGELSVESRVGHGSAFTFRLPLDGDRAGSV
ncbi:PAS domain-containing protein [Cystobacter fuscus]|nr:PAS domain-containing protein [Cystobacter fuscus]